MENRIAVIGSGSTGYATAAWLTMQGCLVTMCDTVEQSNGFTKILERGGIMLCGALETKEPVKLHCMTHDFKQTMEENRRILVCVSYGRQREIAQLCRAYVGAEHAFLLSPGNLGSVVMQDVLGEQAVIGELSGNFWACRMKEQGVVTVAMPPGPMRAAAYPSEDYERLEQAFGGIISLEKGRHILETALNSPNVTSHLAGAVLNAVAIEQKQEDFCLFLDGMSQVLVDCIDELEEERDQVLLKAGCEIYKSRSRVLMEKIMEYGAYPELNVFRSLDGPSDFRHRYVTEDASCGVAMLVSLADHYGVPAKLTKSFLKISGTINGVDYRAEGRTLKNLGICPEEL